MAGAIAYVEDTRVEILESQLVAWTVDGPTGGPLIASGPCPVCGHTTSQPIAVEIMAHAATAVELLPPEERTTRRFLCMCTSSHDGRPPTVLGGCGRWWLVTLVHEGETWRMSPGGDFSLVPALRALDEVAAGERAAVRTAAEKWLPGITVLYGLFGLAAVVAKRDAVDALVDWAKVVIALAAVAGLVATVLAVVWGYRAAFGWVQPVDVSDDEKLRQWYEQRRDAVAASVKDLEGAVRAAVAAVALLVLAAGLVMYSPEAEPAGAKVRVSYNEDGDTARPATACGSLIDPGDAKGVAVTVKDGNGTRTQAVDVGWVTAVVPVKSCK